jgi:tetratricopeptide (TPR) repeat protein
VLVTWQKYDDARAAVAKADTLDAGDPQSDYVRFGADVLEGRWADAAAIAKRESQLADPYWKWAGGADTAAVELYSGRTAAAFRALEASAASQGPGGSNQGSISRMFAAAYLLALGRPAEALAQAQRGLKEAEGGGAEWGCLYFLALAQSRAGHAADAAKTVDTLTAKANAWPSESQRRAVNELRGVLALDRRDTATAVSDLLQAESMLRPRSHWDGDVPHVWIWFDLGSALLAAGRDDDAAKRFQLIVDRSERLYFPIEYVRSLYFLAQIAERRADRPKAREYYQRFVDFWGDGDIDRERVAEARRKIAK